MRRHWGIALLIACMATTKTHGYQRYPVTSSSKKSNKPKTQEWDGDLTAFEPTKPRRFLPKLLRKENRDKVIELVRVAVAVRGGDSDIPFNQYDAEQQPRPRPMNRLDRSLRSLALWLAGVAAFQTMWTVFDHNEGFMNEITDRFLSTESAMAVKMIRRILKQFKDHGVIDVFKKYPAKDVVVSIIALARLQSAAAYYYELQQEEDGPEIDSELLQRLAHYSIFANAAYGWTMEAAFRGRLHMGNLKALLKKTGVQEEDVVALDWESRTHRPSYFIVRDVERKKLVLSIRGTLSARDVLTDLCATAESFETGCKGNHRAHHGMLEAARGVAKETKDIVKAELEAHPDYSLVLVGHSLGGGVAAVLGTLWEKDYPDLCVYGYGSPCVGPVDARPTTCKNIVSVLGEGDPFSCMSLGHIADVSNLLAILCDDKELRNLILIRSDGPDHRLDSQDLKWCANTMASLRHHLTGERMYPPGRLLFMTRRDKARVSIREVSRQRFSDLRLHPRMLDVSRHVPSLYESLLQEVAAK